MAKAWPRRMRNYMLLAAPRSIAEKVSGRRRRIVPNWPKCSSGSATGDVLMVTRLDRLARSTRDLLNILARIAEAGAGFKSLDDAWADTTTAHGRLMLTVLGRPCRVRARADQGSHEARARNRAKARGVKFRPAARPDCAPAPGGR